MAYSEMLPGLLRTLEERRAERSASPVALVGQSLIGAPVPQFEDPWATIATRFAQSLVGGGLMGYAQTTAQAREAEEQARRTEALQSSVGLPPRERLAAILGAGDSDLALQVGLADVMAGLDREAQLQSPDYLLKKDIADRDYELAKQRYSLEERQLGATLSQARATAELAEIQRREQLSLQGAKEMRDLTSEFMKSRTYQKMADFKSRIPMLQELYDGMGESPEAANFLGSKALEIYAQLPAEALMSDDRLSALANLSISERLEGLQNIFSGTNGVIPRSSVEKMLKAVDKLARGATEAARAEWDRDYLSYADEIRARYKDPSLGGGFTSRTFEMPSELAFSGSEVGTMGEAPSGQPPGTVGGVALDSTLKALSGIYNFLGGS